MPETPPIKLKIRAEAATEDMTELVTIPDVEIATTGLEYVLASGPRTFTQEELEGAVLASNNDPGVKTPRLKPGHNGPFSELIGASDQPALGVADNLRMSDDRQSIIGDYVGVPRWLAEIMPSAYPSRSIEGDLNVESGTGRKYDLVITAVSLLGVTMPGISTIEDLKQLYSAEGPEVTIEATTGGDMPPSRRVAAAVDMEDIRRQYYDTLDGAQSWWWVRAIRIEPNELIVDDDTGCLYRVPFTVGENDIISFGDPVKVKVEYVDLPEDAQEESYAASAQVPSAVYATRAESRPDHNQEVKAMTPEQVRERLGLAADASDEDVREALRVLNESAPEQPEADPENPDEPEQPVEDPENPEEPEQPETPEVPEGMALVDSEALAAMRAGSQAGIEARTEQIRQHRDSVLTAAIGDGRIPPARRGHYERMFETDSEGAERLLTASVEDGGLAKGMVPIDETGTTEASDQTSHDRVMAGAFGITKEG